MDSESGEDAGVSAMEETEQGVAQPSDIYAQQSLPYMSDPSTATADVQAPSQPVLSIATTMVDVKPEYPVTPSLQTSAVPEDVDDATLQAIMNAQNEYGTRIRPTKNKAEAAPSPIEDIAPKYPPAKKRAPPKNATKKSDPNATKRPSTKKRKVDHGDGTTASTPRSETPTSTSAKALKSLSMNNKQSLSATPIGSSPTPREGSLDPSEDGSDDGGIYCICRKPDNHTWMIGCDGGCEDWFHGKCVNISQRDEDLIDKYICPNCEADRRGVTTWKPMCRKEGCRRPARLKKGSESKYCSTECGIAFIKENLRRAPTSPKSTGRSSVKVEELHDQYLGPLGGPIRASELKALAISAPTVEVFKELGTHQVLTPPASASPESQPQPIFSPSEKTRLDEIVARKEALRQRRALLKDREKFVVMVKERANKTAEKLKVKETCGFDARLSWDDVTFRSWRDSPQGQAAFQQGTLDPSFDSSVTNGDNDEAAKEYEALEPCTKKRCERHRAWQKLALQDTRFEEADVGDEMRRIDREERDIRDRASIQVKMQVAGAEDLEGGSVEVVDVEMT